MCKQIQENYSSCDVSPISLLQANPPADKPQRYQMPCSSSKSRTQAISQTSVRLAGPELCSNFPLTNSRSTNTTRKQSIPTNHSSHQHSPLRPLLPPEQPLALQKRKRNNDPCRKQHPQRQTLDRRATSRIHCSAPATFGPKMCCSRRHCRHTIQDPRCRGCHYRWSDARRCWLR